MSPSPWAAVVMMVLGAIAVFGGVTYFKKWGYLYREWLTPSTTSGSA
jgi:hypothetical protein